MPVAKSISKLMRKPTEVEETSIKDMEMPTFSEYISVYTGGGLH